MKVREILDRKGDAVATVSAGDSIAQAIRRLAQHGVGALVVSADETSIDGIISERDVVRALEKRGPAVLDDAISSIMTADVHTCALDDHIDQIMRTMTDERIRHLPVVDEGSLVGIISIGDLVKRRLDELENENRQLNDYITGR